MELEQLYQALRNADALAQQGDEQAARDAREIARMIGEAEGLAAQPQEEVGVAEDLARSAAGGLAAGTQEMFDLAGGAFYAPTEGVYRGVQAIGQRLLGDNAPDWMRSAEPMVPQGQRVRPGISDLPGVEEAIAYEPQTTGGEYTRTVASFAPGAALPIGPSSLVPRLAMGALLPGAASEFAGQTTEALGGGDTAQSIARLTAALAAPAAAGAAMSGLRAGLTSGARAYEPGSERAAVVETLRQLGVEDITAGQRLGAEGLMRLEGADDTGRNVVLDVNRAVMRILGSDAARPSRRALGEVEDQLGRIFDDAADVAAAPTASTLDDMASAFDDFADLQTQSGWQTPPTISQIIEEFTDAAQSGRMITGAQIQNWRGRLRRLAENAATDNRGDIEDLARAISSSMDDIAVEGARLSGDPALYDRLLDARSRYRDLRTVTSVLNRGGSDARAGLVSPAALGTAARRTEGERAVSLRPNAPGLRPMSQLGLASEEVVSSLPTVMSGGRRAIPQLGPLLSAVGGGGTAAALGASPELAGAAVLGGLLAPAAGRATISSRYMQEMLMRDPSLRAAIGEQVTTGARLVPGLLAQD